MALIQLKDKTKVNDLAKRVIFNLWKATGGPTGMGFLQDRPQATEEDVVKQALLSLDYPGGPKTGREGGCYMDYVFGRCLKTEVKVDSENGTVSVSPDVPRPTYQDWCRKYASADEALLDSAIELGVDIQ